VTYNTHTHTTCQSRSWEWINEMEWNGRVHSLHNETGSRSASSTYQALIKPVQVYSSSSIAQTHTSSWLDVCMINV